MGQGNSEVIKDNQSKDNKDPKHRKTQTTNSAATCSKAKGSAQINQAKNVELSSPSKLVGRTKHQLTDPAAAPSKTTNDAVAVTPNNQKDPIDVNDRDDFVTKSSISLIDDNNKGGVVGNDAIDGSGWTIVQTGSTSTDNVATVGGAPSIHFSLTDDTGNNDLEKITREIMTLATCLWEVLTRNTTLVRKALRIQSRSIKLKKRFLTYYI